MKQIKNKANTNKQIYGAKLLFLTIVFVPVDKLSVIFLQRNLFQKTESLFFIDIT